MLEHAREYIYYYIRDLDLYGRRKSWTSNDFILKNGEWVEDADCLIANRNYVDLEELWEEEFDKRMSLIPVTGELFNLSDGSKRIIYDDQEMNLVVGDEILYKGQQYSVTAIQMGCRPEAKNSIQVEQFVDVVDRFRVPNNVVLITERFYPPEHRFGIITEIGEFGPDEFSLGLSSGCRKEQACSFYIKRIIDNADEIKRIRFI